MKKTKFLITISILLLTFSTACTLCYAGSDPTFSIDFKDVTIQDAIAQLSHTSGTSISISVLNRIPNNYQSYFQKIRINASFHDVTLSDILNNLADKYGISWSRDGSNVTITPR